MKTLRKFRLLVYGVFAFMLAIGLVAELEAQFSRIRAQQLVSELRKVRVGVTTFDDSMLLAKRLNGHTSIPCNTSFCKIEFVVHNGLAAKLHFAKPTTFGGVLTVKNGIVSYMSVSLFVSSRVATIAAADTLVFPVGVERPYTVSVGRINANTEWKTIVRMTPAAPPKLYSAALNFNVACLSRIAGCTQSNELRLESVEMR